MYCCNAEKLNSCHSYSTRSSLVKADKIIYPQGYVFKMEIIFDLSQDNSSQLPWFDFFAVCERQIIHQTGLSLLNFVIWTFCDLTKVCEKAYNQGVLMLCLACTALWTHICKHTRTHIHTVLRHSFSINTIITVITVWKLTVMATEEKRHLAATITLFCS